MIQPSLFVTFVLCIGFVLPHAPVAAQSALPESARSSLMENAKVIQIRSGSLLRTKPSTENGTTIGDRVSEGTWLVETARVDGSGCNHWVQVANTPALHQTATIPAQYDAVYFCDASGRSGDGFDSDPWYNVKTFLSERATFDPSDPSGRWRLDIPWAREVDDSLVDAFRNDMTNGRVDLNLAELRVGSQTIAASAPNVDERGISTFMPNGAFDVNAAETRFNLSWSGRGILENDMIVRSRSGGAAPPSNAEDIVENSPPRSGESFTILPDSLQKIDAVLLFLILIILTITIIPILIYNEIRKLTSRIGNINKKSQTAEETITREEVEATDQNAQLLTDKFDQIRETNTEQWDNLYKILNDIKESDQSSDVLGSINEKLSKILDLLENQSSRPSETESFFKAYTNAIATLYSPLSNTSSEQPDRLPPDRTDPSPHRDASETVVDLDLKEADASQDDESWKVDSPPQVHPMLRSLQESAESYGSNPGVGTDQRDIAKAIAKGLKDIEVEALQHKDSDLHDAVLVGEGYNDGDKAQSCARACAEVFASTFPLNHQTESVEVYKTIANKSSEHGEWTFSHSPKNNAPGKALEELDESLKRDPRIHTQFSARQKAEQWLENNEPLPPSPVLLVPTITWTRAPEAEGTRARKAEQVTFFDEIWWNVDSHDLKNRTENATRRQPEPEHADDSASGVTSDDEIA